METFDAKEDQAYHLSVNLVVEDTKEIKKEINNDDKKKRRRGEQFFSILVCVFSCVSWREGFKGQTDVDKIQGYRLFGLHYRTNRSV